MKPVKAFWWTDAKNFGDLLTKYWIEKLTGAKVEWTECSKADLFGCGSIINGIPCGFKGAILGSGMMYASESRPDLKGADIRALRGPLTAFRMEVKDVPYGDMGLLFYLNRPTAVRKKYARGYLSHYAVPIEGRVSPLHHLINIQAGIEAVVGEVVKCERLVSSSLHGIILADALGIENKWIDEVAVAGEGFKFRDYAASLGEEIHSGVWRLGNQERVAKIAKRLREIVIQAVSDCVGGEGRI